MWSNQHPRHASACPLPRSPWKRVGLSLAACAGVLLLVACVEANSVFCHLAGQEWICPAAQECHPTHRCIFPDQRTACAARPEHAACSTVRIVDGVCVGGVCIERSLVGCGNGLLDAAEACDGSNLAGRTCEDFGYYGGPLGCQADCSDYDVNGCLGFCGDGARNGPEPCDGQDLESVTCDGLGFPGGGVVTCDRCALDTRTCCQDGDGDGYGAHCDLGGDCDDDAPGIVDPCQADGCPQGWAHVPDSNFNMGCDAGELGGTCQTDEQPRHRVTLNAYCLERTEVSVGDYRACVAAGLCTGTPIDTSAEPFCNWTATPAGREGHPINCINWYEAQEYCLRWRGGNLPTEAQWERAARGAFPDQRTYPWGDVPGPGCSLANWDDNGSAAGVGCSSVTSGPGTWEVGSSGAAGESPAGIRDLAGNVWEWVRDWYHESFYGQCSVSCLEPFNSTATGQRVFRGGGFISTSPASLRVVERIAYLPTYRDDYVGFRCQTLP